MVRKRYDSGSKDELSTFRRVVLSYLHRRGIEGGCTDVSPVDSELPFAIAIVYDHPKNWDEKKIEKFENNLNKTISEALGK
jgi:hypothetical protein